MVFDALRQAPQLRERAAKLAGQLVVIAQKLYGVATALDALTCEINPLVLTPGGDFIAADGKLEIDENAHYRHRALAEELATDATGDDGRTGDNPYEVEAQRRGLTYVHLDGDIGVIGNGAGLVMNTLDLVKQHGGEPADFLDVGGGASAEKVRNSLEMVLLDPKVRGVFINIFGGITRGDEVARGVIAARDELNISKPLVVRMTGDSRAGGPGPAAGGGYRPGEQRHRGRRQDRRAHQRQLVSVLVDSTSRVLIQGITGKEGAFHTEQMRSFGTNVVAGVSPGKGGQDANGVPIFDTVADAVAATGANVSGVFVPPPFAADAIMESAAAAIPLAVCITEGIPIHDMIKARAFVERTGTRLLGPNCPGLVTPGQCKVGIIPNHINSPGPVGIVGRSGTLTYEVIQGLGQAGMGQTTVRRHRRRPDARPHVHRCARTLRQRRADARGRDDR